MENEPYDPHATGPMPPRTPTACRDFASGNGDNEKIWSAFFRNFTPWMRRLTKEILVRNGLTPDDADDVVMIAAEKFTNNAIVRRNAPNGHLRPLVRRVARNTAYDYLRKNGPIRERHLREGAAPDDTPAQTDGASAAPWFDVYGAAVTLNEILGQPALAVYSPAIRAGMDLRPGKRLSSAADFAAAMHNCHKEYRRQRAFSILVRVVTHSLVAALVAALFIFAHHTTTICLRRRDDMRTFRGREIQSQAEYICGEGCKALGDLSNAVQFLERALKDGYRAK